MKIFPGPRSSSCRHFCPFISTTHPNTNNTPLLHVSYQRQIPQIIVYPVDSSGILCLLRAPRVQYSQTRQRGHQSNWDTEMCGCVRVFSCRSFPINSMHVWINTLQAKVGILKNDKKLIPLPQSHLWQGLHFELTLSISPPAAPWVMIFGVTWITL